MLVALAALFLGLGGTGYAASRIVGNDNASDTTLIHHLAPSLSVKHAKTADGLTLLQSGHSESGTFAAGGSATDGYVGVAITYPRPLKAAIPASHVIEVLGGTAAHCPGLGHAAPGYLCLYNRVENDTASPPADIYSDDSNDLQTSPSVGVLVYWVPNGSSPYVGGEYTVTAP
jgi:hypothetical protein